MCQSRLRPILTSLRDRALRVQANAPGIRLVEAEAGSHQAFSARTKQPLSAPDARTWFTKDEQATYTAAFRNGTLQGAYLIIAARALGLDCGPMSGFNNQKVDELFFAGSDIKSNFLCNLGYGDPSGLRPRGPRLEFAEACSIV